MNPAKAIRGLAQRAISATRLTPWARLHTGRRLRVDLANTVGRSIYFRGRYEPELEDFIRSTLRAGDVFVDVGANVGYFSILAADLVGPTGRVFAVEPNLRLAGFVAESAARNSLSQVIVVATGLARSAGVDALQIQESSGVSFVGPREAIRPDDRVVMSTPVAVETLDGLLRRLGGPLPRLVKIDVEGLELAVVAGGHDLLAAQRSSFVMEYAPRNLGRYGVSGRELCDFMADHGYRARELDGRSVGADPGGAPRDLVWVPGA